MRHFGFFADMRRSISVQLSCSTLTSDCEREHGLKLKIGAICSSYPQAVDLAEATGSAVFAPEYGWRRHKEWTSRTQALPGQEKLRRTLQLGWNRKVAQRRNEVAALITALKKR